MMVLIFLSNRTPSTLVKAVFSPATVILVNAKQLLNTQNPIDLTDAGIVILVNLQLPNESSPIVTTEEGIVYALVVLPGGYLINVRIALSNKTPSALVKAVFSLATVMLLISHPQNAHPPIAVTEDGNVILVNRLQSANASPAIIVTDEGIV